MSQATAKLPEGRRALLLFVGLFLVILAYYQVKPASRSIYLEHFSAAQLPYAWLASALLLALLMPAYARIVDRFTRSRVVISSCLAFATALIGFRFGLSGPVSAMAFYILVDILSVVLVEQFWSLTNSAFASASGKRWFGLIGAGGLVGGLIGGQLGASLVTHTPLTTEDLLLTAAGFLLLIAGLGAVAGRQGLFGEIHPKQLHEKFDNARIRDWIGNRYLLLIASVLLVAQVLEPIIEYQFMALVQERYAVRDERTAFLSSFLAALGGVALLINLLVTPLILRLGGTIAGLLAQPLAVIACSLVFVSAPGLMSAAMLKISDRGLSYSINRASRELLYVPLAPDLIYKLKAWIDMLGYRAFKMFGALLILLLTEWTGLLSDPQLYSWIVIPVGAAWLVLVFALKRPYAELLAAEAGRRE